MPAFVIVVVLALTTGGAAALALAGEPDGPGAVSAAGPTVTTAAPPTASAAHATAPLRSAAPPAASAAAARPVVRETIGVRRTRYGRVLFAGRGRALYLFTRERDDTPRCSGACAAAWPPYLVAGRPRAGTGARAGLAGTTRRADGRLQATYAGHPLYFYVGDRAPGQILCQGVVEFGGTWLVVAPDGRPVR